jgi:hypothetical protein
MNEETREVLSKVMIFDNRSWSMEEKPFMSLGFHSLSIWD